MIELWSNLFTLHRKQRFPDTNASIVQNVHICRGVPSALFCRLFFTICPFQKENPKHPKYCIYSVISVPVWRTRPTKIRISVRQLYPNLLITHKKGRFHDKPVQFLQDLPRAL